MRSVRRPVIAVGTIALLTLLEAIADPSGLIALVGWTGASVEPSTAGWSVLPYVAFVVVMLAVVWWVAVRAGTRFWTIGAGVLLAVLLAQAVACLVMTGNLAVAGWASGFETIKAIPAALLVAAATRLFGGRGARETGPKVRLIEFVRSPSAWIPAALFAATAPLFYGYWWTGAVHAPGVPVARPDHGPPSVIVAVLLLAVAIALCLKWMRRRVPGFLGGWLAAMIAGGAVGLVQAIVAFAVDGGTNGDLWPLMAAYVTVADGLAYGACLGWIVGLAVFVIERVGGRRVAHGATVASAAALVLTLVAAVVLPLANVPAAADTPIPAGFLRASGSSITDGSGNQVLLRGVNVNQLVDFYRPRPNVPATRPLTEQDFQQIASYGFNVVRLGLSWSALEPTRGSLDPTYLSRIEQAVRWAKHYGLYVVLDMHQDGWSNAATPKGTDCRAGTDSMWGYDGAPAWATITDGAQRCQFLTRDISPAGDQAFQNFYFDTDGVQDQLVTAWAKLAHVFRKNSSVAGFDLLNEPGFGETAPVTTSYLLGQFYAHAITAIRAAGASQIVFVEPSILWSGLGFDTGPLPGFTNDRNIVFSPHLYAESITLDQSLGIPAIVGLDRQFTLAARVAQQYGAPVWSGEYGYWGSNSSVLSRLRRYAKDEDANLLGSAYWVWKQACGDPQNGIGPTGNGLMVENCKTGNAAAPETSVLDILSRAYPRSAPGNLISLSATGAAISLKGHVATRTCGLDVWIPGAAEPLPRTTGISGMALTAVDGGWTITGCASGNYSVATR